jgi:hypothetical protein
VTHRDLSLEGGHSVIETERISSRTVVTVRRRLYPSTGCYSDLPLNAGFGDL